MSIPCGGTAEKFKILDNTVLPNPYDLMFTVDLLQFWLVHYDLRPLSYKAIEWTSVFAASLLNITSNTHYGKRMYLCPYLFIAILEL